MSSGWPRTPSGRMTSAIISRNSALPCPEPYWRIDVPRSRRRRALISARNSSGSPSILGIPPAKETTSGLLATAKSERTSDWRIPRARSAYVLYQGSRRVPAAAARVVLVVPRCCSLIALSFIPAFGFGGTEPVAHPTGRLAAAATLKCATPRLRSWARAGKKTNSGAFGRGTQVPRPG